MIRQPARTFILIVLALAFRTGLTGESLLSEDPTAVTLPFEIEINGASRGEVIVRSDASLLIVEIEGTLLKELLADKVAKDLNPLIDSLPEGFHTLESYQKLGLEIQLDLERLIITLQIEEKSPYEDKGPRKISLGYQRDPNYDSHSKQATLSAFANFRLQSSYSAQENQPSRTSNILGINHVINFKGYALEGESLWNQQDGFRTRELRLVKDFPNRLWRLNAGDISTPTNELQRGFQLFGINLTKEFGIQPYRTFTPTGSASFDLAESSTVRVTINGRLARTLELEPGSYNLDEFKLAAGPNQMDLRIVTASGLVEQFSVSEFGALNLLDSGVSTYSISYGHPQTSSSVPDAKTISSAPWYERYVEDEPVFSAYLKRGMSNQLTVTLDAQGSSDWNRLGASAYTAGELFGSLSLSLSHNQTETSPSSLSSRLTWGKSIRGYQFSLSSLYTGKEFQLTQAGMTPSLASNRASSSFSITKTFGEKYNVSTNLLHQSRHDGTAAKNANLSIGRRFGGFYATCAIRYANDKGRKDYNTSLTFNWNPARKWRAHTQVRASNQKGATSISTEFDYSNRRANDYINTRINATRTDTGYDAAGSIDYQADLYSASISRSQVYGAIDDYVNKGSITSLSANSAIAFADGAFGFANRINDSFAIVNKHSAWSAVKLGINPTVGGFEKRNTSRILAPVLTSLSPYRETYATIQTIDSDLFLDRNDYYFFPSYKRGIKLKLGSDAIYSVRATLSYSDGDQVKYKAIRFTHQNGEKLDTFTNGAGRLMATGLKPGTYTVTVANTDESLTLAVPKGDPMILMGNLVLKSN